MDPLPSIVEVVMSSSNAHSRQNNTIWNSHIQDTKPTSIDIPGGTGTIWNKKKSRHTFSFEKPK